ncbi:hypothetical protein Tco_0407612 [Tanacetum coccineum]
MFLNLDQLEKQLDKEEFQEIGSMVAFRVLKTHFQTFINSRFSFDDDDGLMTRKYFLEYTRIEVQQFRDTLIQHMESVKKSIDERALHKREYDNRVNERQMQTKEGKFDTSKALDASLADLESSGAEFKKQDTSSRSGINANVDDADIKPVYDEEPMAEVQLTADNNVFATSNEAKVKHDIDEIETINIELEHSVAKLLKENVHLNKEIEHLKQTYKDLYDSIKMTRVQTKDQNDSLIAQLNKKSIENANLKAQIQEKVFANAALKNELRKLKGNSVDTKISKTRFASQVDVENYLSKPVTPYYLPKVRESAFVKPHHVIASSEFRNSSRNMPRFSSNDMVHNHYLEAAKKKTQERGRNSRPSVMSSARSQSIANGCKPKPRIDNQKSGNWPASKTSCITTKTVPISEHSRNSRTFSDSKDFVCLNCHKCVFNANHDTCVTQLLNEVNSRAKVLSHKTTNRYKFVEQLSIAKKPERQIPTRHRFSTKMTSTMHEKIMTPRSCLRWKPTGRIFKTVGLRWVPTGKIFTSSTTKVESQPHMVQMQISLTHMNAHKLLISNLASQRQMTSDDNTSGLAPQLRMTFDHNRSELKIQDHNNEPSSPNLVPNVSPLVDKTDSLQQELDFLFSPLFEEYFTVGNQKPITPTTTVHVEENNTNQAAYAQFVPYEFFNPLCTPVQEVAESSSRNVDTLNMHTFYQRHQSDYRWTKNHLLEQVRGNPSQPVKTRQKLATDPKMCMFALIVSTAEPINIKEAMADHAWIEAM